MKSLKIVVVAGYVYPRISPRSFRATELAKEMARLGHDVTLIASLGNFLYEEFTNKYRVKVKNLGTPYFATKNSDGKIKMPLWKMGVVALLYWAFEFPEICLTNRVKKAILNEQEFDVLITIAGPFSIHWGAALISESKKKFKTWISDCGDPFMGNALASHPFYFRYIEKWWSNKTNFITVPVEDAKFAYYSEFRHKINVIPQGFSFSEIKLSPYTENRIPTFLYAGLFYKNKRDPSNFLNYLASRDVDFKFIVYTRKVDLLTPFKDVLMDKLEIRDIVNRDSLMVEMSKMDFLVSISNEGISTQSPSKLIDYAMSKRPILEISSTFGQKEKEIFEQFLVKNYINQKVIYDLHKYNINNIAHQFLNLNNLVNE